ncbi:MAG: hypothetical protein LBU23_07120 [Planctomycetota bacterium]|jgi:hypothetical protein|nr:hypothetical protein [Planctomycetota bacterium]
MPGPLKKILLKMLLALGWTLIFLVALIVVIFSNLGSVIVVAVLLPVNIFIFWLILEILSIL